MLPNLLYRLRVQSTALSLRHRDRRLGGVEPRLLDLPLCAAGLTSFAHGPLSLKTRSRSNVAVDALKPTKKRRTPTATSSATRPAVGTPRSTSKRKVALFVGYDGAPYHGLQRNAGVETVVDVLEPALHAAGAISDENFGSLEKVNWSVAARTDKGVSCAGNVIALKARFAKDLEDEALALRAMTDAVNARLPPHVRVFQTSRVTSSFSARLSCDERSYEYLLPSEVLPSHSTTEFAQVLAKFRGSHPFHNYTVGQDHVIPPRPQASRVIRDISCDLDPFVFQKGTSKSEWVRVKIRGQSFMLHQIRKMIAMAILVHRGSIPPDAIEQSFSRSLLLNCPPAPAVGLFLDYCGFGSYNERQRNQLAHPVSFEALEDQREHFKQEIIFPSIARRAEAGEEMEIFFKTEGAVCLVPTILERDIVRHRKVNG